MADLPERSYRPGDKQVKTEILQKRFGPAIMDRDGKPQLLDDLVQRLGFLGRAADRFAALGGPA